MLTMLKIIDTYRQLIAVVVVAACLLLVLTKFTNFMRHVRAASGVPISLIASGTSYTENFDTLASTATSSVLPMGWSLSEAGTNADPTYAAGTGSNNTGNTYSFGPSGSPDRAFGGLQSGSLIPTLGACFTNNIDAPITSLTVSYTGEQWRLGTVNRVDRIDFQYSLDATSLTTGTWIDVDGLDFSSPMISGSVGALDGNAASNRANISFIISGLNIPRGATFFIRWLDFNASGSDDGLSIDDFSLTPNGDGNGGGAPSLSINDVTVMEDSIAQTIAVFTISLSSPAGPDGVTYDISTGDNTATAANNDYVPRSLIGETIAEGQQTKTFEVTVKGDSVLEPNETFFVSVTNVDGATVADGQGIGTINDGGSVSLTPINQIQGSGTQSPLVGQRVMTSGIVTGVRNNGFYIQTPDASVDDNPNTSEGIFVFTSSLPSAVVVISRNVRVTGTVQEFRPNADPSSPPMTELAVLSVAQISTGDPLPNAITLTAVDTSPDGSIEQLERFEGMRVRVDSLTVVGPTDGFINEPNATVSSTGDFFCVITGIARPQREAGIDILNPIPTPAPTPNNIPRFDTNPERLRVDSNGQTGATILDLPAGTVLENIVGPLDYAFRTYTILPDAASPPTIASLATATPVPAADNRETTVASFNMQRFFDDQNDPATDDPVLTTASYNNRLNKASLVIRNIQRMPDVIGVEEMENLTTLQAVANKVNMDSVNAGQADPNYRAFLIPGNDIGGINVGFLVKGRISVIDVTQFGKTETFIEPDTGTPALLNDRPPLVLRAATRRPDTGEQLPFTVIVNHLRSLSGVDDTADGNRVRFKRRAQAEYLANLIQARQKNDPNEIIISVGDYNAFSVNDGFVDSIGTIKGMPTPADEVLLASSDSVNPDLINLVDNLPPAERYSFTFDGNGQTLDHILINRNAILFLSRFQYARSNADFPLKYYEDPNRPERISDHDMPVAYFTLAAPPRARSH